MMMSFYKLLAGKYCKYLVALFALCFSYCTFYGFPQRAEALRLHTSFDEIILDIQWFYGPEQSYLTLGSLDEVGRALYWKSELTLDLLFPITYGFLFCALLVALRGRKFDPDSEYARNTRRILWLPLSAALFDICENIGIVILILTLNVDNPTEPTLPTLALLVAALGTVKWCIVFTALPVIVFATIIRIRHARRTAGRY
jgi:hypothetical protein